jgi:hypothetical protein
MGKGALRSEGNLHLSAHHPSNDNPDSSIWQRGERKGQVLGSFYNKAVLSDTNGGATESHFNGSVFTRRGLAHGNN